MAANPLVSSTLASNPTLDISPSRYSDRDGRNPNRTIAWFRYFVPFKTMCGRFYEVRGHDPASSGRDAAFYENVTTPPDAVNPITAVTPYQWEEPSSAAISATQTIEIEQLTARADIRDYTKAQLECDFNQEEFQKRAAVHAIWRQWERAAIVGDSSSSSAVGEFDGLGALQQRGLGTTFLATTTGDPLDDLDRAFCAIRSHDRAVSLIVMNCDGWRKLLELQRNKGFRPCFRRHRRVGQVAMYNGVPVCLNDFITTDAAGLADVYVMTLGGPDGVFALRSDKYPEIWFNQTQRQDDPFRTWQANLFSALVSPTSDSLVRIEKWNTNLANTP